MKKAVPSCGCLINRGQTTRRKKRLARTFRNTKYHAEIPLRTCRKCGTGYFYGPTLEAFDLAVAIAVLGHIGIANEPTEDEMRFCLKQLGIPVATSIAPFRDIHEAARDHRFLNSVTERLVGLFKQCRYRPHIEITDVAAA